MNLRFFYILLFGIVFTACDDDETVCTMDFRTVVISVSGQSLDDVYTIREDNEEKLTFDQSNALGGDTYVVIDDSYVDEMKGETLDFLFVGEINGSVVVEEEFTIRADECHVEYVSGNTDVQI